MKMKRSKLTKGPKEQPTATTNAEGKPRCLVEELKLFQNNHLLNQQDPIQQLHIQLNELANKEKKSSARGSPGGQLQHHDNGLHLVAPADNLATNRLAEEKQADDEEEENIFTVKKGVLWQQQNYDKFHQRLFSRWKKRYFILTTDYLVCFKRSPSKVGHSKMGKFLYKTALSDVTKIEWLKPKKSDKGAIILRIKGEFNLFLWSKDNMDDWMFMISESMERNRIRRSCLQMQQHQPQNVNGSHLGNNINKVLQEELYENAALSNKMEEFNNNNNNNNNNEATVNMVPFKPTIQLEESEQRQAKSATITKYSKDAIRSQQQQPSPVATADESPKSSRHTHSQGDNSAKSSASRSSKKPSKEPIERDKEDRECPSSGASMQNYITGEGDEDKTKTTSRPLDDDVQPSGRGGAPSSALTSNVIYGSDGDGNDLSSVVERSPKPRARRQSGRANSGNNRSSADSSPGQVKRRKENNLVSKQSEGGGGGGGGADFPLTAGSTSTPPSPSKCNSGYSSSKGDNDNNNKLGEEKPSGKLEARNHQRPNGTNLIRRDDSWQSLVSLTRVGRAPAAAASPAAAGVGAKQVAQRSLYAQHIMPEGASGNLDRERQQLRQQLISLESTVTPSRGPLFRQLSMGQPSRRPPRPLLASEQQSASFDVPLSHNNQRGREQPLAPPLGNQATSYQQKLLQLQLMHNSNNVDYVRHGDSNYGYGYGYGPDLGAVYGYSSMRSNLKSAASEFSFIRPASSGAHQQSTLPHQPPSYLLERQQPLRGPAAIASNPDSGRQYLVNPVTGERLTQGAQAPSQQLQLEPPLRELPLKPNKKRDKQLDPNNENQLPKSSSLTSSIASFFRRAFSRRNKKGKRRSKLAESCSSSLGAFDHDGYPSSLPIVPSAFSTGSKSVNKQSVQPQPRGSQQQQRMVDMIEAFAGQTAAAGDLNLVGNYVNATPSKIAPARLGSPSLVTSQRQQPLLGNQFGSPLHKSNSISTTMGLSGLIDRPSSQQLAMYDNAMLLTGANGNVAAMGGLSPMLMRSSKVASAHLANSMQQHQPMHLDYHHQHQQVFASPRSSRGPNDPLPRPSSIYGQPSMISSCTSSPVVSRDERRLQLQQQAAALNFGLHRNSCHGRTQPTMQTPRLHHHNQIMMKSTQLDTTREVAEELGSPTAESSGANVGLYERDILQRLNQQQQFQSPARYNSGAEVAVTSSPSIGAKLNERQAVVNPILQSPTMSAIYDNHPMTHPLEANHSRESPYSASHYDNHMDQFQLPVDQFSSAREDHYARRRAQLEQAKSNGATRSFQLTPSHHQRLSTTEADLLLMASQHHKKPAAIVAPHTPSHHQQLLAGARSPLMSRRSHHQQISSTSHYQQSPLVSHQTRLEKGMNGVQSTIIGQQQQVVNIAGAPGINLEPALAASLLRGTNIDAYESSTFERQLAFGGLNGKSNASNKTFLVSTRLSKSMAGYNGDSSSPVHEASEPENHNSSSRSSVATTSTGGTGTGTNRRRSSSSKDDELSSSGSRSINSSSGERTRTGPRLIKSSHNSNNGETSGSSSSSTRRGSGDDHSRRSSRRSRRQSSSEQSDELPISQLDKKPDERNWITSKLVD